MDILVSSPRTTRGRASALAYSRVSSLAGLSSLLANLYR
jgi:hypothetical protein